MGILKRPHVLVGMGRPKEYRFESAANIQALGCCLYAGNEKARPDPASRGLALHSRFARNLHHGGIHHERTDFEGLEKAPLNLHFAHAEAVEPDGVA